MPIIKEQEEKQNRVIKDNKIISIVNFEGYQFHYVRVPYSKNNKYYLDFFANIEITGWEDNPCQGRMMHNCPYEFKNDVGKNMNELLDNMQKAVDDYFDNDYNLQYHNVCEAYEKFIIEEDKIKKREENKKVKKKTRRVK